jgi:hypothetical protein
MFRIAAAIVTATVLSVVLTLPAAAASSVTVRIGCGSARVARLIDALQDANQRPSSFRTIIYLGPGCSYPLHQPDNFVLGANGLPVVTRHVIVYGQNAQITRAGGAPRFRILAVGPTARLKIFDLEISHGAARNGQRGTDSVDADAGDGAAGTDGGGIHNRGTLILNNVLVNGNEAGKGGAGGDASSTDGTPGGLNEDGGDAIDVTGGDGGPGGDGGAIYSLGTLKIKNSTIDTNVAGQGGEGGDATGGKGGLGGVGSAGNPVGGDGGDGGAANSGHGGAGGNGGAIFSSGQMTLRNVQINDNVAGQAGDAGVAVGGDGGQGRDGGNGGAGGDAFAPTGLNPLSGGEAGAIYLGHSSSTVIRDSNVHDNTAGAGGDAEATGGTGGGGGCVGGGGTGSGGPGGSGSAAGGAGGNVGGIFNGGSLQIFNTTLSNNQGGTGGSGSGTGGSSGPDGGGC